MRKGKIKLYNLIFPLWLLAYGFPNPFWLLVLLGNLIIDGLVLYLLSRAFRKKVEHFALTLLKVWVTGLLCDFISCLLVFAVSFIPAVHNNYTLDGIMYAIEYNPFKNWIACVIVIFLILLSAILIYWMDSRWALKKAGLELEERKKMACWIAVLTAPWLFLLPTALFF